MSEDYQRDKRFKIVEGGFTRGCDPGQYRTRCTGNENDETNPCRGKATGAQEDGARPVPSDQKACSWIPMQAMSKKELDDACRVDSMDAEDADYYMTDQRNSSNDCIFRFEDDTWNKIAENDANASISFSKPFTFGNLNSYVGFGNLLTPTMYGYRRTKFSQANMEKCCLGAGTFQQGGFRPLGASCTHGKNDCLSMTWDNKMLMTQCWSSTGNTTGGICRQDPAFYKGKVIPPGPQKRLCNFSKNPNACVMVCALQWNTCNKHPMSDRKEKRLSPEEEKCMEKAGCFVNAAADSTAAIEEWEKSLHDLPMSASKALPGWKPNPNNQWTTDPSVHPAVCDTVWTPGVPQKEKADPRSESADDLWAKSCGTVFVTGAEPFCTKRFNWLFSHLTKDGMEELGRIQWDVWPDASRVPFPAAYTKGLVLEPKKKCNSTDLKQPGCPCDQSPNAGSRCKVDFAFEYCKRPTYLKDIQWCAENCAAFKHVLTCGPFPRPGCGEPKSNKNPNGYPVTKDDVAKFIVENQTMCKTMRGGSASLVLAEIPDTHKSWLSDADISADSWFSNANTMFWDSSAPTPTNDYDVEVKSRLNDALYCQNWMLGNYAKGKANASFRASICNDHSTVLTNGAGTGIVDLCNVRQETACMKGQDGTTPMAHCPGWKQANAFGDFCRKVALAYPVQADAAKIAYCDKNFLDETCDCLKAGVIGTKQKGCDASEPKAKNVGDRTAFCAQTTGSSNAISQLLAKNRANWYNYCQADGANADYTLKPAFVWSADQTKCTKDAKEAPPGVCKYPNTCQKMEQPDHICANIISVAGQSCVATGDGTCNVFKNIHMSNRCGNLSKDRKECLKGKGNKWVARPRIVYDDSTHKPIPCSDDKGCASYKGDGTVHGQTARCDITKSKCAFFDFVCLQPDRCEANVTCPKGQGFKAKDAVGKTVAECCAPIATCATMACPKGSTNKPDTLCRGAKCDKDDEAACCTPNQTCEAFVCPEGFAKTNVHSHCEGLTCDPDKDKATCCVAKKACGSCPSGEKATGKKFCDSVEGCKADECCVHEKACSTVACPPHHVRSAVYCEDETNCKEACCTREPFMCSLPILNIVPLSQGLCARPLTFANVFDVF